MTNADERHLGRVLESVCGGISRKYRAGVQEHGGHLPNKAGMLSHADAEVLDLNVYMTTLREQLMSATGLLEAGDAPAALALLRRIVGPAEE